MDSSIAPRNRKSTSLRRKADTTFDRVWKFYFQKKNGIKLKPSEEAQRERWETAWKMLCGYYTRSQIVTFLARQHKITERLAYQDIDHSMRLFGDPKKGEKLAKMAIVNEWIIKGIKKAWDAEDMAAYERLIGKYSKVNGLDVDNENVVADMLAQQKPTMIVFTTDTETLKKQAANLMEGTDQTDDIDYIDVEDED